MSEQDSLSMDETRNDPGKESLMNLEIDFELLDRFHAFGAEIVRLPLLTPTVVAFTVALAGKEAKYQEVVKLFAPHRLQLGLACIFLASAILCGLTHRYFSIDALVCYIQAMRIDVKGPNARQEARKYGAQARWRLRICGPLLGVGCGSLALGAASLLYLTFNILSE
jgi:hypothetical protein